MAYIFLKANTLRFAGLAGLVQKKFSKKGWRSDGFSIIIP